MVCFGFFLCVRVLLFECGYFCCFFDLCFVLLCRVLLVGCSYPPRPIQDQIYAQCPCHCRVQDIILESKERFSRPFEHNKTKFN